MMMSSLVVIIACLWLLLSIAFCKKTISILISAILWLFMLVYFI